jgi:hypothetical protein
LGGLRRHRVSWRGEDSVEDHVGVRGAADRQRPGERFARAESDRWLIESWVDAGVYAEERLAVETAESADREGFPFGGARAGELRACRESFRFLA